MITISTLKLLGKPSIITPTANKNLYIHFPCDSPYVVTLNYFPILLIINEIKIYIIIDTNNFTVQSRLRCL